jgi:hypothetical protein
MTTKGARQEPGRSGSRRFVGSVAAPDAPEAQSPLARLVLTGGAATFDKTDVALARGVILAALASLRERGLRVGILVTPAGFAERRDAGEWTRTMGWRTTRGDFDRLAVVAADVVRELVTPEIRALALGAVGHMIVGVDVWPARPLDAHAETASLYDVAADKVIPITGKSYPNTSQQDDLIRDPDIGSHVIVIGDERVAVLVCHDLAAWSPRGNAVAKGVRAATWEAMQAAVAAERPTLAVQLPHTVDTPATWRAAWSRFVDRSGGALRSGTSAIRHLDRDWHAISAPPDARLLAGTGRGDRAIDVFVTEAPT